MQKSKIFWNLQREGGLASDRTLNELICFHVDSERKRARRDEDEDLTQEEEEVEKR